MRVADLDYELPRELIAQRPTEERDGARLLVVPTEGSFVDDVVRSLPALIPERALLVVNDTKVVPARLIGRKIGSGGTVELFLLKKLAQTSAERATYRAMARASKALRPGTRVEIGSDGSLVAEIEGERRQGERDVTVVLVASDGASVDEAIERVGHVPLPPYVDRADDAADRSRYQTLFARVPGAVAAPTAGFHLSQRVLDGLAARSVELTSVTLHVGLGTFAPVTVDDLDQHDMHEEVFEVSDEAREAVARARDRGAPVVAVGTTVVRALESARDAERPGHVRSVVGSTKMLIQPGYEFSVVDRLMTNFHLPKSTLLALVAAFAGRERILAAYAHAVRERYRFFSYGDAMLLGRATGAGGSAE